MTQTNNQTLETEDLLLSAVNYSYDRAKRWSTVLLSIQGFIFVGGITAIFVPQVTLSYPWIAFPLTILNTLVSAKASKLKGIADETKRKHEYFEGFGIVPSKCWLADFRVTNRGQLPDQLELLLRKGIVYSSKRLPGPERMLENLIESSWFSRHLASWCAHGLATFIVVSVIGAIALLLFLLTTLQSASGGEIAAKAIAATLLFLISLGVTRNYSSYSSFSRKSEKVDDAATELLESGKSIDRFDAYRLLADYQLARAGAPLIPTWVWRINRNHLNANWKIKKRS
ncbi:MAG: hypothetical protein BGO12_13675 [Verrucomicrobia bacterium 61-8]|nr:MAG: hypothetical protein BGO12_13675 [Verrucomicrobia bacterium 61-8]